MSGYYLAEPDVTGLNQRQAAKAKRRMELLRAAAKIMADKGFHAMRLEDLGEAAGISGPAVYRYFSSKEEILTDLMTGISEKLLEEARAITRGLTDPRERLQALIHLQIDFAMTEPELIRLHARELFRMAEEGRERVRRTQGAILKMVAEALASYDPRYEGTAGRVAAQLLVGQINSLELTRGWASPALARQTAVHLAEYDVGMR